MTRQHLKYAALSLLAPFMLASCVTEDLQECPNEYNLRIVYDRNMLNADAFASQVKSVDIQVFDHTTGQPVYRHTGSGEALASDSYSVNLPIPAGTYDILCWGGLSEGQSFGYTNGNDKALDRQGMRLNTADGVSAGRLNDLFHGLRTEVRFVDNNTINSRKPQTQTVNLTKNTNRVNVILLNLDGTEMKDGDFTCTITSSDGEMAYDNSLVAGSRVTYRPWAVTPIVSETIDDAGSKAAEAVDPSGLSAEFSLARLTPVSNSRLDVVRNDDGETIISVPLEANLLLYKGAFYYYMSDGEYLDRRDDYTITFILDSKGGWDRSAMIYIQDWATLPVQYQDF